MGTELCTSETCNHSIRGPNYGPKGITIFVHILESFEWPLLVPSGAVDPKVLSGYGHRQETGV
jgi:hypothetical protein